MGEHVNDLQIQKYGDRMQSSSAKDTYMLCTAAGFSSKTFSSTSFLEC